MTEELKFLARFCKHPNKPASIDEVTELEERLQIQFPADYASFLAESNGGEFRGLKMLTPWRPEDELECLYGVGTGVEGGETLGSEEDLELLDDNWPILFLPIGRSLLHDLLLMDFSVESRGSIWIKKAWDSEGFQLTHASFATFLRDLVENA